MQQLPSGIRGSSSSISRITQASYGLQNIYSLTCTLVYSDIIKSLFLEAQGHENKAILCHNARFVFVVLTIYR